MTAPAETLTLTDFLLARLDEDEQIARYATSGPWRYDPMKVNSRDGEESVFAGPSGEAAICVASTGPENGQSMIDARHIATHDPARVLAEVAAKRAIVDSCRDDYEDSLTSGDDTTSLAEEVLRALASVYADHPDYREEWQA